MNEYYDVKLNTPNASTLEVFVTFKKQDLYQMMKNNEWKQHASNIHKHFKGYNDNHRAMKFSMTPCVSKDLALKFADDIKRMLIAQISIYNFSNISYNEYRDMEEKRKRDNYDYFMKCLRGEASERY